MSEEEKIHLREEFIKDDDQGLFHLNQLPEKKEIFEFIVSTRREVTPNNEKEGRKRQCHNENVTIDGSMTMEEMVFSLNEHAAPNRVIVMDDLMKEAFNSPDKQ